jgi:hypothetical protein
MAIGSCVKLWKKGKSSMKRETARWVRKAEADIQGARQLAAARPTFHDLVCFIASKRPKNT